MGSSRNQSRKKRKIPPSRKRVVNQDGKPSWPTYKDPGPSARKIGKNAEALCDKSEPIANILKEGTIFMDLYILFNVFNVLKCPDCSCDIDSHVDMKNKCGYSNYIVLQCENIECGWRHSFNSSKKQGRSYIMNVRSVLAFREIGKGHNAMQHSIR